MPVMRAGRALARPFLDVAAWYTRTAIAKPVVTAFFTSGIKTSAADMFAQKVRAGFALPSSLTADPASNGKFSRITPIQLLEVLLIILHHCGIHNPADMSKTAHCLQQWE